MKTTTGGFRVAVVGASSLLGKEILNVLEERSFPIARLVTFEANEEEPDLPIVDLQGDVEVAVGDQDVNGAGLDLAFLAGTGPGGSRPAFVRGDAERQCVIIDLTGALGNASKKTLSVPLLERSALAAPPPPLTKVFVSPHPATIVISSLLLRLAGRFTLKNAVVVVFGPASEMGARGVEELQRQTVNLLSFQKIPQTVFGAQLAFNLLPRLGGSRRHALAGFEKRIVGELRQYLGERVPLPALHLLEVPVFYSFAFSIYLETVEAASPEALEHALAGERIRIQRASQAAPSQVNTAGSADIQVDAITADSIRPTGRWIWATADNLRLTAVNAVEIAERVVSAGRGGRLI